LLINHAAAPITGEHVLKILNHGIATALGAADSILTDLSKSNEGLEALSKLDIVVYGGGPLSPHTGTALAPYVKNMSSLLGMTENALFHCVRLEGTSHWDCLKFNSHVGYRFEEVSPGRFELIISFSPQYAMFHPAALIFPDLREYATKDLYSRVPGVENCYHYEGRKDDLIVLSNCEKINPLPMEAIVASHPAIQSALFVGEYRFLPSLLIELRDGYAVNNEEETRAMIEKLWGIISEANLEAPRFSRVPKSLVYILSPTESFSRSGKMTVQRQITVAKFAAQVDALYAAAGEGLLTEGLELLDSSNPESIKQLARNLYLQALDSDDREERALGDDDDVFELGMDSLQVAILVQKLKAALKTQNLKAVSDKINPHFFYTSPSSSKLARSIDHLINGGNSLNGNGITHIDRRARMQYMIDKYSAGLDDKLPPKKKRADNLTVILTGSTGSLGSYLLHSLIESPLISKVICLNRSVDSQKKQTIGNKLKELSTPWENNGENKSKTAIRFLTADFSKPDFSLGEETYNELLATVDTIIHCAWKVDFNHTMESFEKGHIAGTRHFIDFSRRCEYQTPILFISSISTIFNWSQTHPGQAVPESCIHDVDSPEFLGYGESKYVAERLVEAYSKSSGFTSSFMRVGQIAGPVLSTAGVWNVQEWFPSMLASSKYLGLLPDSLGTMDVINWIPVDVLARIIVQLLGTTYDGSFDAATGNNNSFLVYNLVNPKAVPWSALLNTVQASFGGPDKIRIVSLTEWTEALERSAQDNYGFVVESNPGTKLLGFWKNVADKNKNINSDELSANGGGSHEKLQGEFEVTGLQRDSSEASGLKAVSPEWMKIWLKQWAF
jgi:thioester reductase-like protein